jgi:dihydrolipoamide dehydrogenase
VRLGDGAVLAFERLLVATGRRPCFDGHDLEAAGIATDERGRAVLGPTLRTTAQTVWVGGDATGDLLFTHVGDYEAKVVAADVLGHPFERDYRVVPRVTYCEPEVASVGLTQAQAEEEGHDVAVATAAFADNSRAFLEGETAGHVKLVADRAGGELLGGHVVGEAAGELIAQVALAMSARIPSSVVADTIHAYPTRSEAVRDAFRELASLG